MYRLVRNLAVVFAFLCVFALHLPAQLTTATIVGTVADASHAVISGAKVTATNKATGFTKAVPSNEHGDYRLEFLPIGDYVVTVEAPGFATPEQSLTLNLNAEIRYDANLQPSSATQTVNVTADVPLIQSSTSSLGSVIDNVEVDNLPIVNRNVYDLLSITPGVQSNRSDTAFGFPQQIVFINGGTDAGVGSVSYYLDGGINMTFLRNTGNVLPNPDALQEFSVETNNYNALFGRMSSGLVNVATKSGTNKLHGSIFEFFRSDKMNATPAFSISKPKLHRNQYGATLGGPILHDKTFFFGSYGGLRQTTSQFLNSAIVPTAQERASGFLDFSDKLPSVAVTSCTQTLSAGDTAAGDFILCNPTTRKPVPNNNLKTAGIAADPTAINILKNYVPAGNTTNSNGQPIYQTYVPLPLQTDEFLIKVDHQLTSAHRLELMYFNTAGNNVNFPGGSLPWATQLYSYRQQNANVSDTWSVSSSKVNQIYATYTRMLGGRSNTQTTSLHDLGSTFVPQGLPSLPQLTVTNYFTLGDAIQGPEAGTDFYSLRDVFSWNIGKHALAFGGEGSLNKDVAQTLLNNYGVFTFSSSSSARTGNPLGDFVLGLPQSEKQDAPVTAIDNSFFYGAYLQDDWKIHPRLVLNLGVRYDIQTSPTDPQNRNATYIAGRQSTVVPGAPPGLLVVGDQGVSRSIADTRYHHISPRVGFSWDPYGTGKTALRGAAGVFYGAVSGNNWNGISNYLPFANRFTFPSNKIGTLTNAYAGFGGVSPFPYTYVPGAPFPTRFLPGTLDAIDQNYQWPYTYQVNLTVQQQLSRDSTISMSYVGSFAHDLPYAPDINAPQLNGNGLAPTSTNYDQRRPMAPLVTLFTLNSSHATAHYHGLQVDFQKRLSHSFSVKAFYTWSKTLNSDELSTNQAISAGAQDFNDLRQEYGRAAQDLNHQAVATLVWKPQFLTGSPAYVRGAVNGWTLSAISSLQSGSPFTVTTGRDNNLDGQTNDRASLVPGVPFSSNAGNDRSLETISYFDKAAFCSTNGTSCPGIGPGLLDGNTRRNQFTGPGSKNVNAALFRDFSVYEAVKLQFRTEVTNVFNLVNLNNPTAQISSGNFGQIRGASTMRQIQLGARILF